VQQKQGGGAYARTVGQANRKERGGVTKAHIGGVVMVPQARTDSKNAVRGKRNVGQLSGRQLACLPPRTRWEITHKAGGGTAAQKRMTAVDGGVESLL